MRRAGRPGQSGALCRATSAPQPAHPAEGESLQQTKGSADVKTWDRCPDTGRWSAGRNPLLIGSGLECALAEGQLLPLLSRNNIVYFYLSLAKVTRVSFHFTCLHHEVIRAQEKSNLQAPRPPNPHPQRAVLRSFLCFDNFVTTSFL